jgi:hypothetical protein
MTVVFIFGLPSLLLITNKRLSVGRPRCSQPAFWNNVGVGMVFGG